jgi:acetoin utilization deacetylase AcuC-like enzyme
MQAEWARRGVAQRARPLQVAVVDLDVHQGNGTAHIFQGDDSVFTLSLHGAKNFPFRKEASDCDIELPDGSGDDAYMEALEQGLNELERRFEPDLLIYLAGADPHEGDRLGRLKITFDGMEARDRRVFDWAWQHRVPLAMSMAGGYGHDMASTVQVQMTTFRLALSHWQRWQAAPEPVAGKIAPHEQFTPPAPSAQRLPCVPHPGHPLDGQRHLRPCQQRGVLQLVRHGRQQLPD